MNFLVSAERSAATSFCTSGAFTRSLRTAMTASMFDDPQLAERLVADYPLGIGAPADVVDAVEFLLSDKARWITGQQLVVDGGRSSNITA